MIRHCSPIVLISLLALGGCDKDKPKVEDKKPESTPVPSGLVFNDFALPGSAAGLTVRDAGLEGGLAAVGGGR